MRIGIIGTGAMGCLFAAYLAPRADVTVLGTWQEGVNALNRHGVWIERDGYSNQVPVRALSDPRDAPQVDLALVLVKGYQTERAAAWSRMILDSNGIALTLQNGIGNIEIIESSVGAHRSALGVSMLGATLLGPGHVRHAGQGPTTIAYSAKTRTRLERVAEVFNDAGIQTYLTDDVSGLVWGKLIVNSAINALTAILRVPNGWLLNNSDAREVMVAAALETAAVARALGVKLPYPDPVERVLQVATATAANRSSTLQDVLRGTPTELDRINGAVAREGKRLGVATPVNDTLIRIFQALRAAAYESVPAASQITIPSSIRQREPMLPTS